MPRRKDDPPDLVTIKVRIPEKIKKECEEARLCGLRKDEAESTFMRYLIELGLNKYKKSILPAELCNDESPDHDVHDQKPPEYGVIDPKIIEKAKRLIAKRA